MRSLEWPCGISAAPKGPVALGRHALRFFRGPIVRSATAALLMAACWPTEICAIDASCAWYPLADANGQGVDGTVRALAVWDDGSGPALIVGGDFSNAATTPAGFVAKWDGTTWSAFGTGLDAPVFDLAVFDDGSGETVWATGLFSGRVARYDAGTDSWNVVGTPAANVGDSFAVFSEGLPGTGTPQLFLAGMDSVSGDDWPSFEVLEAGDWTSAADFQNSAGGTLAAAYALPERAGLSNQLAIGGIFADIGPLLDLHNVARWDGTTWHRFCDLSGFDCGTNGPVSALASPIAPTTIDLFIGGSFSEAGGQAASNIARWTSVMGEPWSTLGAGTDNRVRDLLSSEIDGTERLWAVGWFQNADGQPAPRIAAWDGAWSAPATGPSGNVEVIADFDGPRFPRALYVGGNFTFVGSTPASRIARFECGLFRDGFESGDTSRWVVP